MSPSRLELCQLALSNPRGPAPLAPGAAEAAAAAMGGSTGAPGPTGVGVAAAGAGAAVPIGVSMNSPKSGFTGVEPGIGASPAFGAGDWARAPQAPSIVRPAAQESAPRRRDLAARHADRPAASKR